MKENTGGDLREAAEERLDSASGGGTMCEDATSLLHELRVHQVELEMQNEELRKTHIELEESRSRYSDLYDFAPVGYLTFSREGIILEGNLAAAGQLGIKRSRLISTSFRSYVFQPDKGILDSHLQAIFRTRERQICEVRLTRNGELFHARIESIYVGTAPAGVCRTSVSDITSANYAQEVLRRAHDELEGLVEERTRELARSNEQLRMEVAERGRAQESLRDYTARLEKSYRDLQEFASIASHDLQEPLRKIQTFGNRIREAYETSFDTTGRDYLDRMLKATVRMSEMLQGLLDYSRLGSRSQPLEAVDLTRLVRGVVSDLEIPVSLVKARIEITDLPVLEVDSNQIRQMFQHLIGNCLKFHGGKTPVVKIYGRPADGEHPGESDPGGRSYRLFVEDNGIGFDEKYLDRIFTMFQRLHGKGAYEGMGAGLAICRKIVERHHGSITARSEIGRGSTFIITLPERQPAGD